MKSQIKVDYKSRYGDGFSNKEPIIRAEVIASDDPRDTLLAEVFEEGEDLVPLGCCKVSSHAAGSKVYSVYKRDFRDRLLIDVIEPAYLALRAYTGLNATMITSSSEIYFEELSSKDKVARSSGISDFDFGELKYTHKLQYERTQKLVEMVSAKWKELEQLMKKKENG